MKKLLAAVISLCLALSLCAVPAMAEANLSATMIEECVTSEVSTAITKNFTLPETWNEAPIKWESSDPSVIQVSGNTAVVTRGVEDATVTLTATDLANPLDTKVLTFTVLSLTKKVWYNENFYNKDAVGDALGYSGATTGKAYEFVEKTAENEGQAGFMRFSNAAAEKISVQPHPVKANDYAILMENSNNLAHIGIFALPSLSNDELPKGNVKVSLRLSSDQKSQKWKFGFNGTIYTGTNQDGNMTHMSYRYNAGETTSYSTWGQPSYEIRPVTQMPVTPGLNVANDQLYYLDTTMTFNVDTDTNVLSLLSTSPEATYENTYKSYEHPNKIYGLYETNKVLKSIYFVSTATEGGTKLYVDDIVITTDEIAGDTADERLAIYKHILTGELDSAIADKTNVTDDFSLDLLADQTDYTVTWASDDESAIVINGKTADVQLTEIIKNVTLTGTITHDGATDTITLPLTVKPYGSVFASVVGAVGSATGKVTYEDAATGSYASGALNDMHKSAFSVVQENGNKYATVTGTADAIQALKYGSGGFGGRIVGKYKTISFDAKINKPTVSETQTVRTSIIVGSQNGHSIVQLIIPYVVNADGTYTKSKWYVPDGNSSNFRYVDDERLETLPGLDEWFNLQIVINTNSYTYDVYVNGVKLLEYAAKFPEGQNDTLTAHLYSVTFNTVSSLKTEDYKLTTICWDNMQILNNDDGNLGTVSADLMLASIDSLKDTLTTAGANGTAIAWTATGDATVSGNALAKTKDFGYGEAVVTATATVEGKGTLSRAYNLYYGTAIKAVDIADGKLQSIKYASDAAATGYIAYYNASNALLRVAPFAIQAGRNTRVFGTSLPEEYDSFKVFAWNAALSPLNVVYP